MYEGLIDSLRTHVEWARANEWESPITLGDDLEEAINAIEALTKDFEFVDDINLGNGVTIEELQAEVDALRKMQPVNLEEDEARSFVLAAELSEARTRLAKLETERDRFEQMYLQSEADAINLTGELSEFGAENARLRRERDAAVSDLKECDTREPGGRFCKDKEECYQYVREHGGFYPECDGCPSWQWRGPDGRGDDTTK